MCVGEGKEKKRKIRINKNYDVLKERRIKQNDKDFRKEMSVRSQIEGTISELVRFNGLRKIKYKCEDGRQFQFYCSGSALNIKRIIRIIVYGKKIS